MTDIPQPSIAWTKAKMKRLQKDYNKAVADHKDMFTFTDEGKQHELVTNYAKYLLEYLGTLKHLP
jgi:hypothetical protein